MLITHIKKILILTFKTYIHPPSLILMSKEYKIHYMKIFYKICQS